MPPGHKTGPGFTGRRTDALPSAGCSSLAALASSLFWALLLLQFPAPPALSAQLAPQPTGAALFRIGPEVVNPRLQAFTVTSGGLGSTLFATGSGFEPVIFRDRFTALADSPDHVILSPESLSYWDTLRDGALDDAEVRVYRIENGRFVMVRHDRVAPGGCAASGWLRLHPADRVLPPERTRFRFRWASYHRPGVPDYFTVRAVDRRGELSPAASAVAVTRPDKVGAGGEDNLLRPAPRAEALLESIASSLVTAPHPLPAPTGLRAELGADGLLSLTWDAVPGADVAGYAVFRADAPPERQRGYFLRLAGTLRVARQSIRKGDIVVVSKKFYSASRNLLHSHRVWAAESENRLFMPGLVDFFPDEDPSRSWALLPHQAGTPVKEAGETFLRLSLAGGVRQTIGSYNHAGTDQDWYSVLEPGPYRVQVWLRSPDSSAPVRFLLTGFYGKKPNFVAPIEFRPSREWRLFTATFAPPAVHTGDSPGQMLLEFSGPGTFDIDNFRVHRDDTPFLELEPADREALRQSGMAALRTHAFIKTRRRTYDLEQFTNPGGVSSGTHFLNTLPQTLAELRRTGLNPWLQIEPHLSPEEWLGLIEYLAAPCDAAGTRRWACKRAAQGHPRPWTEAFERIDLELGNETWNRHFRPWTFEPMSDAVDGRSYSAGEVYGLYQEYVLDILRSSPYWAAAGLEGKLRLVLGGQLGARYGRDAARTSPRSDALFVAPYIGGWDMGAGVPEETPAGYFNILNQVSQTALPLLERHRREIDELNVRRTVPLGYGTYESGPGYVTARADGGRLDKDQRARQERVMKSLAAGSATLDAFLVNAGFGMRTQNFFTFGRGARWTSHASRHRGGQPFPAWSLLALFNREAAGGDLLATRALAVPSLELPGPGQKTVRAPLVSVHAVRRGDRMAVFVISRRMPGFPDAAHDGHTPVRIELPFRTAQRVTLHRMTGPATAHNVESEAVRVERVELPAGVVGPGFELSAANGAGPRGLPPASVLLYVFDGVKP